MVLKMSFHTLDASKIIIEKWFWEILEIIFFYYSIDVIYFVEMNHRSPNTGNTVVKDDLRASSNVMHRIIMIRRCKNNI